VEEADAEEVLRRPYGVAAGPGRSFFVSDPDLAAVVRVDEDGSTALRCASLPWAAPMGLATSPDGALLVADPGLPGVVRVDRDGRCVQLAPGAFQRPIGVAAAHDRIYVVDADLREVVVLGTDGAVLERRGRRETGDGQLLLPVAATTRASGDLLVTDALGARVARWSAQGSWAGRFDAAAPPLARPKGIARAPDDRVYVADAERDEVVVYLPSGERDFALGASGAGPGRFAQPAGVAVAADRLLVADGLNARVQVFEILGGRP
jgi:DNA-binding beta-propeller fold protein YncE